MTVSAHNPDQTTPSLRRVIAQRRQRIGLLVEADAPAHHPAVLLGSLAYGCAHGVHTSRKLERRRVTRWRVSSPSALL